MNPDSVELVQTLLIPGIFIIAASILLISTNSRYSMVVDRIRLLKEERSGIRNQETKSKSDSKKLDRIEIQLSHLIVRISLVRIIIASYSAAILFFVVSSVLLVVRINLEVNGYYWLTIGFIFGGLLAMLNGVVFSVIEIFKAYRIVKIEFSEIRQESGKSV